MAQGRCETGSRARVAFLGCVSTVLGLAGAGQAEVVIPADADWRDHGVIAQATYQDGDWNHLHAGLAPCALFEYDAPMHPNRLYAYYVGSDGNRQTDGGPRHRAIGASYCELEGQPDDHCEDPAHWLTHPQPIIRDLPHEDHCGTGGITCSHPACGEEEGAWSCAVVEDDGVLRIFYGALRNPDACTNQVSADNVSIQTNVISTTNPLGSFDGYIESETVLAPTDTGRACYLGDEWSGIGAQKHADGDWSLWSTRVSSCPGWTLVHSQGTSYRDFAPSAETIESQGTTYGGMDGDVIGENRLVWLEDGSLASGVIRVHTSDMDDPASLQLVDTYGWNGDGNPAHDVETALNTAVHLDEKRGRWWLVYRNGALANFRDDEIRLKTALVSGTSGPAVSIPPVVVLGLGVAILGIAQRPLRRRAS